MNMLLDTYALLALSRGEPSPGPVPLPHHPHLGSDHMPISRHPNDLVILEFGVWIGDWGIEEQSAVECSPAKARHPIQNQETKIKTRYGLPRRVFDT
jgi:hypothetical protein